MTRQTHLGVPFGCLLLLLLCAQPCLATQCADLGLVCSGTPPPPPADCLTDGTAWTYNAIAECCSGYAFGAYCGCLPVGEPVQGTAAECCSRNSDGGSPDLCTAPCVQKNGVCEPCVGRRRSLQGMMELQCNCCTNLLCILNTTSTPVCASNPSPPGIGEITATSSGSGKYTIEVTLIASNDTGAVGIDMQIYILSADIVGVGYAWTEYVSPGPSLKATRSDQLCGTSYVFSASCQNTAFVQSSSVTKSYSLPAC